MKLLSILSSIANIVREGGGTLYDHFSIFIVTHYDNEWDIYTSFKNYKENNYKLQFTFASYLSLNCSFNRAKVRA